MPGTVLEARAQRRVAAHDERRHQLGNPVADGVRVSEHTRRVAHRGSSFDRGERDDLGDAVPAVTLGGVADHLAAVARVEVHVDVGHLLATGIEEPLEQEVVADRIEVDDLQAVRHAATGRAPPAWTDADALLPRVPDEIPDDEEVRREAHVRDDAELVLEALGHLGRQHRAVPVAGTLEREVAEVLGVGREAGRQRELGQLRLAELDLDIRPLGDPERVVARDFPVREERPHLGRSLEVVLVRLELEALRVVDRASGLHAQERVVGDVVGLVGVVAVVRREQRRLQLLGDLDELRVRAPLVGETVVLQLDEQVVAPEDVLQPRRLLQRAGVVALQQRLQHDTAEASRRRDDALVMLREQLPVEARLVEVSRQVRVRRELHQVAVALVGLGQQREVVVELLALVALAAGVVDPPASARPLVTRVGRHVGLGPDHRRQAGGAGGAVEVEDAVHVAVVGDADGRLTVGRGRRHHLLDAGGPVEHRELGVEMEVGEAPATHRDDLPAVHSLWTITRV